jgi:isopentenyl-diphosphate Delta-isomerase
MPNMIDVLSDSGLRTGELLPRKEIHRLGKIHRTIHLYLFNSKNEVLLQKRSMNVDNYPGIYSISVLGHVDAGEYSSATVRREIEEELGVSAAQWQIEFLFTYFSEATLNETYIDRQFNDVYITWADLEPKTIKFDPSEVAEVKFVPFEAFRDMVMNQTGEVAPVYERECRDLVYFLSQSRP